MPAFLAFLGAPLVACSGGSAPAQQVGANDGPDGGQAAADAGGSASTGGGGSAAPSDAGARSGNDGGSSTTCGAGQTICPKGCFDLAGDVSNCGSCGYACPTGPAGTQTSCVAGKCVTACTAANETYCANASACVDVLTSADACGRCDAPCPSAPPCAARACANGTCGSAPDPAQDGAACSPDGMHSGYCKGGACDTLLIGCQPASAGQYTIFYGDGSPSRTGTVCACSGSSLQFNSYNGSTLGSVITWPCGTCVSDGSGDSICLQS